MAAIWYEVVFDLWKKHKDAGFHVDPDDVPTIGEMDKVLVEAEAYERDLANVKDNEAEAFIVRNNARNSPLNQPPQQDSQCGLTR